MIPVPRPWLRRAASAAAALLCLWAVTAGGVRAAETCPPDATAAILALVNDYRAGIAGLSTLTVSDALAEAARVHAEELAARRTLDHRSANGDDLGDRMGRVDYPYKIVAENLASGPGDPAEVIALWVESPGHRDNLLARGLRHAGIACVPTPLPHGAYWVLVVAAPFE